MGLTVADEEKVDVDVKLVLAQKARREIIGHR